MTNFHFDGISIFYGIKDGYKVRESRSFIQLLRVGKKQE